MNRGYGKEHISHDVNPLASIEKVNILEPNNIVNFPNNGFVFKDLIDEKAIKKEDIVKTFSEWVINLIKVDLANKQDKS